jgi:hypothetical protein
MAADDPQLRPQPYNRRLLVQLTGTSTAVSLEAAAVGQLCAPQLAGWVASLDAGGLRLSTAQQQRQQVVDALVADAQALADEVSREHGWRPSPLARMHHPAQEPPPGQEVLAVLLLLPGSPPGALCTHRR